MAIAHDTKTFGAAYTSIGTQTVSHAASASAQAAVVLITTNGTTADQISGVTYGGVAMSRILRQTEATEAGSVEIWFLDGVATGTQDVAMTSTGTNNKRMSINTLTATSGYSILVGNTGTGTSASVANPSWSITGLDSGETYYAYEVIHSGLQTMTTTPATGWTLIDSQDIGSQGRGYARLTSTTTGVTSITCGWTAATAEDYVGGSVALYESASTNQSLTMTGVTVTPTVTQPSTALTATVSPTAIGSTASLTSPDVVPGNANVSPTAIASTASLTEPSTNYELHKDITSGINSRLGIVATVPTQDLALTGITVTPTVTQPSVSATASLSMTGVTVTPTVTQPSRSSTANLSMSGIASTASVTQPTTVRGAANLSMTGITVTPTVTQPSASAAATVSPTAIAGGSSVTQPSTALTANLTPTAIASTASVTQPSRSSTASLTLSPIAGSAVVTQPSTTIGAADLSMSAIAAASSVTQPSTDQSGAGQTLSMSGIASTASLTAPSTALLLQVLEPGAIASTASVTAPTVSPVVTLSVTAIAAASAVTQPNVNPGSRTLSMTGISATTAVTAPSVSAAATVTPTAISSGSTVGSITTVRGAAVITLTGISSTATVGTISTEARSNETLTLSPISATTAVTEPSVIGLMTLEMGSIDAAPSVGTASTSQLLRRFRRSTREAYFTNLLPFSRIGVEQAKTVILKDNALTITDYPMSSDLEQADAYWLGGRDHSLSAAEYQAIVDAGGSDLVEIV